jgi:hypothetical protein
VAQIKHRKASDIYKAQNTLIHKAFAASGLPYEQNKEVWLELIKQIVSPPPAPSKGGQKEMPSKGGQRPTFDVQRSISNEKINGLSDLTLGERQKLINYFQKKGIRLFSPAVPVKIRDWKKGNDDVEYEFRLEDDTQVRMVYAMWAEMGYTPKTLRGLCFKMFRKDDPRWLNDEELNRLVHVVKYKAETKGCGAYYAR